MIKKVLYSENKDYVFYDGENYYPFHCNLKRAKELYHAFQKDDDDLESYIAYPGYVSTLNMLDVTHEFILSN